MAELVLSKFCGWSLYLLVPCGIERGAGGAVGSKRAAGVRGVAAVRLTAVALVLTGMGVGEESLACPWCPLRPCPG